MSKYNVNIEMKDKDGELKMFSFHPVLYSLIKGGLELMKDKRHYFGLITGNVGDGKSNLACNLAMLWEHEHKRQLGFNNIVWTTQKFLAQTDREDNKEHCIWWDEAIQGVSGKKMALTTEGELLKISLVTKRFKKHFYLLLVDEVEEYSWKLIKMANFWLHCETHYRERGYFKGYIDKKKIKSIYQAFKYYKWDWSRITLKPDIRGRFYPYLSEMFDEKEYDKMKLQETKVLEKEVTKDKNEDRLKQAVVNLNKKYNQTQISDMTGIPRSTIRDWIKEFGGGGVKSI